MEPFHQWVRRLLFFAGRRETVNYRILLLDSTGSADVGWMRALEWDEYGFEIAGRTADPADAVSALSRGDFDTILCLHRPSQETAVALLSRVQKRLPDVPVIVVSSADDSACMRQCFLYGATDFLVMPLNADDVRSTLRRTARQLDRRVMHEEYQTALDQSILALQDKGVGDAITEKLRELMEYGQETPLTTEAAAAFFGFNRDYFTRYFKKNTGITFSEYHKGFTMEYAKLLLSGGHFKVQEVSDILGFSSADYFTRVFKKRTGKTPSEFKKL